MNLKININRFSFLWLCLLLISQSAVASSWDPTLVVNTEAFQIIDDGNGSSNLFIQFGDSLNETLSFDITLSRFAFSDDLHILGNLSGSGTLAIEGSANIDGSTLSVDSSTDRVGIGVGTAETKLEVAGTASGLALHASNRLSASGNTFFQGNLTFIDGARTITANSDGSTGYGLTVSGGTGSNGDGGALTVQGGDTTGSAGGALTLRSGDSVDGNTGNVDIFTADATEISGNLTIRTGDGDNDQAGDITITAGNGVGAGGDGDIFFDTNSTGDMYFGGTTSGTSDISFSPTGEANFNELGNSVNFRVEGDNDANLISTVGSSDRVGIGTGAPETKLEVIGTTSGSTILATKFLGSSGVTIFNTLRPGNGTPVEALSLITGSGFIINEDGVDMDFRVESESNINMLFIDASTNRVGIGTGTPETTLDVFGSMSGSTLNVSGLKNCDTIDTNADGLLACGTDGGGAGTTSPAGSNTHVQLNVGGAFGATSNLIYSSTGTRLEVRGTSSGSSVQATKFLGSSGVTIFNARRPGNGTQVEALSIASASGVVINEDGNYMNFRVEGRGDTELLTTDGFTSTVGIGQSPDADYKLAVVSQERNGITLSHAPTDDSSNSTGLSINVLPNLTQTGFYPVTGQSIYIDGENLEFNDELSNITGSNINIVAPNEGPAAQEQNATVSLLTPYDSTGAWDIVYGQYIDMLNVNSDLAYGLYITPPGGASPFSLVTAGGNAVFNEDSGDYDFRVESNSNISMLFVDGGTDRVGIGTGTPETTLEVVGTASGLILESSNQLLTHGTTTLNARRTNQTQVNALSIQTASGGVVINEDGNDMDFRVEGSTDTSLIHTDPTTNTVGIGTGATLGSKLFIEASEYGHGQYILNNQPTPIGFVTGQTIEQWPDFTQNQSLYLIGSSIESHADDVVVNNEDLTQYGTITSVFAPSVGPDAATQLGYGSYLSVNDPDSSWDTAYGQYINAVNAASTTAYGIYITTPGSASPFSLVTEGGNAVFNESGGDYDFRAESDSNINMLFVDGGNNRVGIGTGAPDTTLDVLGTISGSTLQISGLKNCNTIDTNANGLLACGTDDGGAGSTTSPAGSNTQVQLNVGGAFGATSNLYYSSTGTLFDVRGTSSGSRLQATKFLGSSGVTIFDALRPGNSTRVEALSIASASGVTINEDGNDMDFRVEGGTDQFNFFSDASTDRVGIGTNAPRAKFEVIGTSSGHQLQATNFLGSSGVTIFNARRPGNGTQVEAFSIASASGVTINEDGNDIDFRVEGSVDENLLYTRGDTDTVGIGTVANAGIKLKVYSSPEQTTGYGTWSQVEPMSTLTGPMFSATDRVVSQFENITINNQNITQYGTYASIWAPGEFSGSSGGDQIGVGHNIEMIDPDAKWDHAYGLVIEPYNVNSDTAYGIYVGGMFSAGTGYSIVTQANDAIFNESNWSGSDFQVETAGSDYTFFVNGLTDRVGIGTSAPSALFDVKGTSSGRTLHATSRLSASGGTFLQGDLTFIDGARTISANSDPGTNDGYALTVSAGGGSNNGGALTVHAGDSSGGGLGGALTLRSGDSASGNTGNVTLQSADAEEFSGNVTLKSGDGNNDDAGDVFILAGAGAGSGDGDIFVDGAANSDLYIGAQTAGSHDIFLGMGGAAVFNDQSNDQDFRVESNNNINMLFVDGGTDRVGIGLGVPDTTLDVLGTISGSTLQISGLKNCDTIDTNASGLLACGTDNGGSGSPGGAVTQVQYHDTGGVFNGDSAMLWEETSNVLEILGTSSGTFVHATTRVSSSGGMLAGDGTVAAPTYSFFTDRDSGIYSVTDNTFAFATAGVERFRINGTEAVVNDASNDFDFRVESDSQANAFIVDASTNQVGMNNVKYTWPTAAPSTVSGAMLTLSGSTAGTNQLQWSTGPMIKRINTATGGTAGPYMTWQNLSANSANCATTGLCFPVMRTRGVGAGTWKFKYTIIWKTAVSTVGIGMGINHTGTAGEFQAICSTATTATTTATATADSDTTTAAGQMYEARHDNGLNAIIGAVLAGADGTGDQTTICEGIIVVTATGDLELKISSETAGTNVFVKADTSLELMKIE